MRRGRSRSISIAALARQESEERKERRLSLLTPTSNAVSRSHTTTSKPLSLQLQLIDLTDKPDCVYPSSSPSTSGSMTPIHDSDSSRCSISPLPPPLTIQDQLHVAYALDDIHLAKILLLKLRGIEVTSDSDPRIAAIQPEDFDECFIPAGGLMSAEDEKDIKEMQRAERERLRVENERRERREREEAAERHRQEWEKHCEKIWEDEKKRMKEQKEFLEKKREEARRQWEEAERRRRMRDERRISIQPKHSARSVATTKPKLSYASLSTERTSSSSGQDEYLYAYNPMPRVPLLPSPRRSRTSLASSSSSSSADRSGTFISTHSLNHDACSFHTSELHQEDVQEVYEPDHLELDSRLHESSLTPRPSNTTVSFREVLTSMRGPLFPLSTESESRPRYPRAMGTSQEKDSSHSPNMQRSRSRHYQDTLAFTPGHNKTPSYDARRRRRDEELLATLLVEVKWLQGERLARSRPVVWDGQKEKQNEDLSKTKDFSPGPTRQNSSSSIKSMVSSDSCAACSATSSSNPPLSPTSPISTSASSSSSAFTRAGSWFSSFSSSTGTNITTPSSSSLSTSPIKPSSVPTLHPAPNSTVKSTVSGWLRKSAITQHHRHSCDHRRPYSRLTLINAVDGPLSPEDSDPSRSRASLAGHDGEDDLVNGTGVNVNVRSSAVDGMAGAAGLARQMTRFVELAKGFQTAYINMTVFAAVPTLSYGGDDYLGHRDMHFHVPRRVVVDGGKSVRRKRLRPVGFRVCKDEVGRFISGEVFSREHGLSRSKERETAGASNSSKVAANDNNPSDTLSTKEGEEDEIVYIPLVSPFPPQYPPRTTLPSTLPYALVFKSPVPTTPSPHRRVMQQSRMMFEDGMEFGSLSASSSSSSSSYTSAMKGTGRFSTRLSSSPPPRGSIRSRAQGSRSSSLSPTRRSQNRQHHPRQQPPPTPIARPRLVPNPVYLRLKAVKNAGYARGMNWDHSGGKNCGPLSGGKEKMLSLAWDDIGRSCLVKQLQQQEKEKENAREQEKKEQRRRTMFGMEMERWSGVSVVLDDRERGGRVRNSRGGATVYAASVTGTTELGAVRRGRCVVKG